MSVTATIILDTRRIKQNNTYPVKLRVNHQQVTNYYPTIIELSEEDYQKLSATRISNELQVVRDKLKQIERTVSQALEKLRPFSFVAFEKNVVLGNPLFTPAKKRADHYKEKLKTDLSFDELIALSAGKEVKPQEKKEERKKD